MQKCVSNPDIKMKCTVESGRAVWTGVNVDNTTTPEGTCSDGCGSMPWRKRALCNPPGKETCYSTLLPGGQEGAVCLNPTSYGARMTPSTGGLRSLLYPENISPDKELSDVERADLLPKFTACYAQPFKELHNTSLVTYVPKNDQNTCNELIENARDACRRSGNTQRACDGMVLPLFKNANDKPYRCVLDTNKLPVSHSCQKDSHAWWRWVRHNQYDCRDGKWKCDDAEFSEYVGGLECQRDAQCQASFEAGVCDVANGHCKVGHSRGSRCKSHEECDHVSGTVGKCGANRHCSEGKNGVDAAYYMPAECAASTTQGHVFCGKTEDGNFTGVCTAYKFEGKEYLGCRAFEDADDIREIQRAEQEYQHLHTPNNFSASKVPSERLRVCAEKDIITLGGHRVCRHTSRVVHMTNGTVPASNEKEAIERCNARTCSDTSCPSAICARNKDGKCTVSTSSHIASLA